MNTQRPKFSRKVLQRNPLISEFRHVLNILPGFVIFLQVLFCSAPLVLTNLKFLVI